MASMLLKSAVLGPIMSGTNHGGDTFTSPTVRRADPESAIMCAFRFESTRFLLGVQQRFTCKDAAANAFRGTLLPLFERVIIRRVHNNGSLISKMVRVFENAHSLPPKLADYHHTSLNFPSVAASSMYSGRPLEYPPPPSPPLSQPTCYVHLTLLHITNPTRVVCCVCVNDSDVCIVVQRKIPAFRLAVRTATHRAQRCRRGGDDEDGGGEVARRPR